MISVGLLFVFRGTDSTPRGRTRGTRGGSTRTNLNTESRDPGCSIFTQEGVDIKGEPRDSRRQIGSALRSTVTDKYILVRD